MSTQRQGRLGFTLIEVSIAALLTATVVSVAVCGWVFMLRGNRLNSVQNELDMDVRIAMENLKQDLRLSSMDHVYFYPEGYGPYVAVSFPMARDDDGDGAIELDDGDKIVWDQTVIYHRYEGTPNELRRTVFDPRDNTLSDVQRYEQLAHVVETGSGTGTHNGSNATTRSLFKNLFDWSIRSKIASIDCYALEEGRTNVPLGSAILSNGVHAFMFKMVGKNDSSGGWKFGTDTLVVSPCGREREAEWQTVSESFPANPVAEYMPAGAWSGNYRLSFPETGLGSVNSHFTLSMDNDRWEETTFQTRALCQDTRVEFEVGYDPKDFVVRLDGTNGWSWFMYEQTGGACYSPSNDPVSGYAVRLLMRGSAMSGGSAIKADSGRSQLCFYSPTSGHRCKILKACMAECDSLSTPTNSAKPGTTIELSLTPFYGEGPDMPSYYMSTLADYPIDKTKSYLVTFLVSPLPNQGNPYYSIESIPNMPASWLLPGATLTDVSDADWSGKGATPTNRLYGVYMMYTTYPTNGYYTSDIVDTHLDGLSNYTTLRWSEIQPYGAQCDMRIRATNDLDALRNAPWSNVTARVDSPQNLATLVGRYVQWQAQLRPSGDGCYAPTLRDVTVTWEGQARIADIGGTFATGPDYGVFELTVDGRPLARGITVELEIYEDVRNFAKGGGNTRLTSPMTAEIEPRNTGK